jgi:tRNA 2-thiouridine synthesizing protein A
MPVICTQAKVQQLRPGDTLAVLCTDPGVVHDIPAWCRVNGHEVLDIHTRDDEITISIRVG